MGRLRGMVRAGVVLAAPHCSLSMTRWPFPRLGTENLVNWLWGQSESRALTRVVVVVVAKVDGLVAGQLRPGSIELHVEHYQAGGQDQKDQRDQQDGIPGEPF